MDLKELYQDIILEHGKNPRNFGKCEKYTHQAKGYNPLCGDQVTVFLKVSDEIVEDVSFEGVGCAISKSSASMMTEGVKGKSVEEALIVFQAFRRMLTTTSDQVEDSEILGDLEILKGVSQYPTRIKCATLSWHTLQAALQGSGSDVSTE